LAVGVVVVIGLLAGRHPASIGLGAGSDARAATNDVLAVALVLAASALIFRFGGSNIRALLRRQARGFIELLPRSRQERLTFGALAITAGVCEEVVFRGFGIAYVRWLWPAASQPFIIVVTAAAFGFAHLYQGIRGVVLTGLVGAYLAWLTLSTGSLLPAIVVHALIDLRVLALPDLDEVREPAGYGE
jgi:membrane protease YdiL (CAAX protease family)